MLGLFRKTSGEAVTFCERCGATCDSACRAEAIREHARDRAFVTYGWRQV